MPKLFFKILIFVFFIFSIQNGYAQISKSRLEAGADLGAYVYQGDLSQTIFGSYQTVKPGLSVWILRNMNSFLSLRLSIAFAQLKGDESIYSSPAYRKYRNLAFTSSLKELSLVAMLNPLHNNLYVRENTKFKVYALGGIGLAFNNATRDFSRWNDAYMGNRDTDPGLQLDLEQPGNQILPVLIYGVGVKQSVTPRVDLSFEFKRRNLFSDFLDGFSYVGDPNVNDAFYNIAVGACIKIGYLDRMECRRPKN